MKRSKITYRIFAGLCALTTLISCNREGAPDCFKQAGEEIQITRDIAEFDQLELEDYIQIELIDSSACGIKLIGPKNVLPKIKTEVNDGVLHVSNGNTCNFVRSFKREIVVQIFTPTIRHIENRSTGNIRSVGMLFGNFLQIDNRHAAGFIDIAFTGDSISVQTHTGVADVKVSGIVHQCILFNQGLGIIDAAALQSENTYINNSSINDVYAYSSGYLYSAINFSGNNFVSGHPTLIDERDLGDGELILTSQ